jgi:hypothetical protein
MFSDECTFHTPGHCDPHKDRILGNSNPSTVVERTEESLKSMCCVLYNNKRFSGFSIYFRRPCNLISVPRYVSENYNADLVRRDS